MSNPYDDQSIALDLVEGVHARDKAMLGRALGAMLHKQTQITLLVEHLANLTHDAFDTDPNSVAFDEWIAAERHANEKAREMDAFERDLTDDDAAD